MKGEAAASGGDPAEEALPPLFDMHCHLDFAPDPTLAAAAARDAGMGALSVTVTPEGYADASRQLAAFGNVRVALGLHPWWVADGRCGEEAVSRFEQLAPQVRFVGEVGLDFGARCASAREAQLAAFERVAAACAEAAGSRTPQGAASAASAGPSVISLHAVRAEREVLDVLARYDLTRRCACVFHWFSGPFDQLQRAVRVGCWFSMGARMLASRRGREYARAVPEDRLLLETDLPAGPGHPLAPEEQRASLLEALAGLEAARGARVGAQVAQASARLLGMGAGMGAAAPRRADAAEMRP